MTKRSVGRCAVARLCWFAAAFAVAAPTAAQQQTVRRVRARVTQIAGLDLYVPVGRASGLLEGDTVRVLQENGENELGWLVVRASSEQRAVLNFAGRPFAVTRGAVLLLEIGRAVPDSAAAQIRSGSPGDSVADAVDANRAPSPRATPPGVATSRGSTAGPVIDGSLSLNLDAVHTSTRWGVGQNQRSAWDEAIPSVRLDAVVHEMPGGLRMTADARVSYRHSSDAVFGTPTTVRFYELAVEKEFDSMPSQFTAGRFYSPSGVYGGYWDGVRARLGRRDGVGVGGAFGFAADRAVDGFSSETSRWSAFLDYHSPGDRPGYDADLSFSREWSSVGGREDRYFALSQHVAVNGVRLDPGIQVNHDTAAGAWRIAFAHADASLSLTRAVQFTASYSFERPRLLWYGSTNSPERRERRSAGLSAFGRAGSVGFTLSEFRTAGLEPGRSATGFYYYRPRRFDVVLTGSASYWTDGDIRSLNLAPGVAHNFGSVRASAGYRFHRTDGSLESLDLHAADLSLWFRFQRVTASIMGQHQWGAELSSTRLSTGLWVGF